MTSRHHEQNLRIPVYMYSVLSINKGRQTHISTSYEADTMLFQQKKLG